ncbi:glycosyltransferase [Candidatus Parcubacteria bacterium]|nr:glycosyltransferase [Patescibacteria group bacterium]MBU4309071.1 glycosyltransferase [Patescibacteria group bacterium]MBU4432449.1 glycosyltransferase [Patescibacteria group bacterium]MBU4577432.1 glycosyltransferase [Patescibacteria group bacterium]MCG2697120.1 glycosyltransferase [Candidatus Parcubacteria bacterium]
MKICLINNLYKPFARGGAEIVLESINGGLAELKHDVFVISTTPRFNKKITNSAGKYNLKSCYYNLGKMPVFFRLFWHFYDMFDIFTALQVKNILSQEKPDLIITNNLKGISFLLPLIIKKTNTRHIHILHDVQLLHPSGLIMHGQEQVLDSLGAKFYMNFSRYLFNFCEEIVSPSQWLLDQHLKRGFFKKITTSVIPNPVNINKIEQYATPKNNIFQFLYVGQVEKYKGVEFLANALATINGVELKIVGDGSYRQQLVENTKNKKNIIITGRKSKEEVVEIMKNADCLIVPSLCYENSPTVIYEAMAAGLPVLGSRIGGITELLHDIGGILFNPGDQTDLQKKIDWIIKNPQKIENLKKNYTKNINNYSLEKYLQKILKNFSNRN